ncbi:MAG: GNAT family N-acetyltransferase [Planctomycetota bacterium]
MRLEPVTLDWESAVRDAAADYEDERFDVDDYAGFVERLAQAERGEVPPWKQPFSFWILVNDDDRVIGSCRLRHGLNDSLWQDGGHIGYDIRRSERGKGYGTRILELTLEKARARGLEWVLLTVDPSNTPSIRVIERCGGQLRDHAEETGYRRYIIPLF